MKILDLLESLAIGFIIIGAILILIAHTSSRTNQGPMDRLLGGTSSAVQPELGSVYPRLRKRYIIIEPRRSEYLE